MCTKNGAGLIPGHFSCGMKPAALVSLRAAAAAGLSNVQTGVEVRNMKSACGKACVGFLRNREGFTIIRLLVTIGIVGVLLGTASPNIASVTRVYSVRSAARQVYSELQNARMAAVMANQSYTFTVNVGGTTYTVTPSPGSATALEATGITMSAPNPITFASNGTASATATVTVSNSFGDAVQVAVGSAGRVRIQ